MLLSGQRALVTGASRGIGLALSQRLATLGCSVTMLARDSDMLYDNISTLSKLKKQEHKFIGYDLMHLVQGKEPDNHGFLVENLNESTILVNCAGLANYRLLPKLTNEAIVDTVGLNLIAPILLSKMAISPMLKLLKSLKVTPNIVNVSSLLSSLGVTISGTVPYCALKAGILGLTESLAAELNGKIRVNAVLPALVPETDMGKAASKNLPKVALDDVVEIFEKVVTDESVNGKFIIADGKGFRPVKIDID